MEKTIRFTNNFGKTFTLGPSLVSFLKLKKVFDRVKSLGELAEDILHLAMMPRLKEDIKVVLIRFGQFIHDSDSLTASEV
jgi:hypothetical protein